MRNNQFQAQFNRHRTIHRVVGAFIGIVFVLIVVAWSFMAYTAYQMSQNPEKLGAYYGEIYKGFRSVQ